MNRSLAQLLKAQVQYGQPRLDSQSRVPVQDPASARVHKLEDELSRAQTELGSLHNQLQPWETIIPAQAVDDFRQINKSIRDICRTTSESILRQNFADVEDPTTLQMPNPARFARSIGGYDGIPSLVTSWNKRGRPLDDVFEFGLRSIINQNLWDLIFRPFHPSLSGEGARAASDGLWHI